MSDLEQSVRSEPGDPVPVVRIVDGQRSLAVLTWGLIPHNNRHADPDLRPTVIRDDSILSNPFSRAAVKYRRCVIPIDQYVTFGRVNGARRGPVRVHMEDNRLFYVAGVWELWMSPAKEKVETAALITVDACDAIFDVNHRMPAVLDDEAQDRWLDHSISAEDAVKNLKTYNGTDIVADRLFSERPAEPETEVHPTLF